MTDPEAQKRIERLEYVLGTLIGWLYCNGLGKTEVETLLKMLDGTIPCRKPPASPNSDSERKTCPPA